MAISLSTLILVLVVFFIFRKSISRVSEVAPEVASITVENIRRAAVAADENVAVACIQAHQEVSEQAAEIAQDMGVAFNGDVIDLYNATVKSHDYSRRARKSQIAANKQS